jgi:hypothetical protein
LDAVLGDAELLGYSALQMPYQYSGLPAILSPDGPFGRIETGPVQYTNVEVGDGRVIQCVANGIFLADRAVFVISTAERPFGGSQLKFEGIAPDSGVVHETLDAIRAAMREHNVYRGRTISLHAHDDQSVSVVFHQLPAVARDAVILPDGTLERPSATRSASPSTPSGCARPAATSSAASCSTGRRARARRCRSTTCSPACPAARRSSSPAAGSA